jgi:pyruvate,orthophosphate dikinase
MIDLVLDAQGEDVVSGRRTPDTDDTIARALPGVATELTDILKRLEQEFGDVQDVEFTVEDGKLWILQTRSAKRTPRAALRIAIDLVHEGLIAPPVALRRIDSIDLATLTESRLADASAPLLAGIGASGSIAVGRVAFTTASAERLAAAGDAVILMRPDTSTADIAGFAVAAGIVTASGARTSHAALVARQLGKPCVVGCSGLVIDEAAARARLGSAAIAEGDWISIDGGSGQIYLGSREVVTSRPETELAEVARWRAEAHAAPHHKAGAGRNGSLG